MAKYDELFGTMEVQSGMFTQLRDYLEKYNEIKELPIFQKIYRFFMYILSLGLLGKVGVTFDTFGYSHFEAEALRRKFYSGPDFVHCLLDTVTFIVERGYTFFTTGNWMNLFYSPKQYGDWYDNVEKINRMYPHLNDPESFGFTESSFLALLDDTLEKGESIKKHALCLSSFERKSIERFVNELHIKRDDILSKKKARESRLPPFSVLICGGSGIGKSTITDMLYHLFAQLNNLESDDSFKYTRNALANYWDGFVTSQHTIVLDDIANIHVTKAPNGDPTLIELLNIVNQVAFVPDQASLQDKGRTPMRPRFVIGTTNTENLNAHAYFSCPSAVQRRFPYIIIPKVRPEFLDERGMLDSSKTDVNSYPDYWTWTVKIVLPNPERKKMAITEIILEDVDLVTFLKWFGEAVAKHNENQSMVKQSLTHFKEPICPLCKLPRQLCKCSQALNMTTMLLFMNWFFLLSVLNCFRLIGNKYMQTREYWEQLSVRVMQYKRYPIYLASILAVVGVAGAAYKVKQRFFSLQAETLNPGISPKANEERYNPH
jgi:hypothetical protein